MLIAIGIIVFFLVGFIFVLVILVRDKKIAEILKIRYPELWEQLGRPRPSLFPKANDVFFNKFIMQKEYLSLADQRLQNLCHDNRRWVLIFIFFFIFGLVLLSAIAYLLGYR